VGRHAEDEKRHALAEKRHVGVMWTSQSRPWRRGATANLFHLYTHTDFSFTQPCAFEYRD
jgi:hypothetical protein